MRGLILRTEPEERSVGRGVARGRSVATQDRTQHEWTRDGTYDRFVISVSSKEASPAEYASLRAAVGFGSIDVSTAEAVLDASLLTVAARDESGELCGFGRAVGDGRLYAFITDVFVHPNARSQGVGELLTEQMASALLRSAHAGATIAVFAAPGRETFYERFGFERAPNAVFGSGMTHLGTIETAIPG